MDLETVLIAGVFVLVIGAALSVLVVIGAAIAIVMKREWRQ